MVPVVEVIISLLEVWLLLVIILEFTSLTVVIYSGNDTVTLESSIILTLWFFLFKKLYIKIVFSWY